MSEFVFRRDYKTVQWGQTLWLNLLRPLVAGLVLTPIMLISDSNNIRYDLSLLAMPFVFAFVISILLLAFSIAAKIVTPFARADGDAGMISGIILFAIKVASFVFTLLVIAGDPLVFGLYKLKPALVPVEKFSFMNFTPFIWVLDPEKVVTG
jgi:hypothetical protein